MAPIPLKAHLDQHLVTAINELEEAKQHMKGFTGQCSAATEKAIEGIVAHLENLRYALDLIYESEKKIRSRA